MLNAIKWSLIIVGGCVVVMFCIGLLVTAFHSEPIPDEVEEALKEVTRKRGKRK